MLKPPRPPDNLSTAPAPSIPVPKPPTPVPPYPKKKSHISKVIIFFLIASTIILFITGFVTIYYATVENGSSPIDSFTKPLPTPTIDPVKQSKAVQLNQAEQGIFSVHNNYDYLFNLSEYEEGRLGVTSPPEDTMRVTVIRGVPMYETACRPFNEDEIARLALLLNTLPQEVLDIKPKGIVSACIHDMDDADVNPKTSALTSGPYIYLGDEFFIGQIYSDERSENEKLYIFMHEYAHVLQYYYVHQYWLSNLDKYPESLDKASTLVYDYAESVGWQKEPLAEEFSFFNPSYTWTLSNTTEAKMITEYGRDQGPAEDFAEGFGLFVAGQYQTISYARSTYFEQLLDTPSSSFISGVVPQYPTSLSTFFDYDLFLKDTLVQYKQQGKNITDTQQWSVGKSVPFSDIVSYYHRELANRSFEAVTPIARQPGAYNDKYAYGVYKSNDKTYIVSILGSKTTGITKSYSGGYTSTIQYSVVVPDQFIITVLTYE